MAVFMYPAQIMQDSGTWLVTFRDLPEALTEGATTEEAQFNAIDCLNVALLCRIDDGEPIPEPSFVQEGEIHIAPSVEVAAKVKFIQAFQSSGLTRVALAARLNVAENEVRRMLDTNHRSKIDRLDKAMQALGKRFVLSMEAA